MIEKTQLIQHELQVLQQGHERKSDSKNSTIQRIQQEFTESQSQYTNALRAHLMHVDSLMQLQQSRLSNMMRQYDLDRNILESDFNTERY
jgi:hypothetical protein